MMERTLISELREHIGDEVRIAGWVHAVRDQKSKQFVIVRDHTGRVQLTIDRAPDWAALNDTVAALTAESVVEVQGVVNDEPRVKLGGIEMRPSEMAVLNAAEPQLPIDVFGETESRLDKRLDWRFLDLRRPEARLVFEVQTGVEQAMREFWREHDFLEIHSPKLMGTASETGAELFRVEYFGRDAYLAQSPQFYKQMAMAAGFDRVFEIAPVFRANPSFTGRHDTEFTSVDVEMAWIDSHEGVMSFEEQWLRHVLARVRETHGERIEAMFGVPVRVPETPFPRLTLAEALSIVGRTDGGDLGTEDERAVGRHVQAQNGHEFVFITDYPASVRPFYHMRFDDRPDVTKSFDLLWKGLEITTGAQREHRHERLVAQAREKDLALEPLADYLGFFRFGCPPHGGFGFGLTRMLMVLLGESNVREVTFVPRDPNRLRP